MPTPLPLRPDLEQFKKQAKDLLRLTRGGDTSARRRLTAHRRSEREPTLADAQLAIAREHGFVSWARFVEHITAAQAVSPHAEAIHDALMRGDEARFDTLLDAHPEAAREQPDAFARALARIADRSVWHRPQYTRMAARLVASGCRPVIWPAARLGLGDYVMGLIDGHPSLLDATDELGRTPLQRAALIYGRHPEATSLALRLIEHGAATDLHTAATFGLENAIRDALERDSDIVHGRSTGSGVLNWAVRPRRGDPEDFDDTLRIASLLLDAGANLEDKDQFEDGMTPLMHAAEWGTATPIAGLLLDRGADPSAVSECGWTALDYAQDRHRSEMVAFLRSRGCEQARVAYDNPFGNARDEMIAASKSGDVHTLRRLIESSPGIHACRADDGDTPLHWAAHNGHLAAAELLTDAGADVNALETNHWGFSVLQGAAEREPALVEFLLAHNAEVDLKNPRTGQTALHYNARCGDVAAVTRLLVAAGANVNALDRSGRTPLDYAEQHGHERVARVLTRAGAEKSPSS